MGVIIPNPTVETEDESVSVANVKTIQVTNGDLTDDPSVLIETTREPSSVKSPLVTWIVFTLATETLSSSVSTVGLGIITPIPHHLEQLSKHQPSR
jgi:hypothetical protein